MTSPAAFPGLGFDPTPGSEQLVGDAAAALRAAGAGLEQISHALRGTGSVQEQWRGQAAVAFRAAMDEDLRPQVETAALAFSDAHRTVRGWWDFMTSAQDRTRRLEAEAADLIASIKAIGSLSPDVDLAGRVERLGEELSAVRALARRHEADYGYESQLVAERLRRAIEAAPNEPGFWSRVTDRFGDAFGGLTQAAEGLAASVGTGLDALVENLAPVLQTIGDVAGILSAVCGLLSFVPGLQFLGPISLVLAGTALLTHYGAAAVATGSPIKPFTNRATAIQLGLDAAGLVAGIGAARAAGKVVDAATAAGNLNRMPQQWIVGGRVEIPQGFFQLAKGGYSMGMREFALRVDSFILNTTGNVLTGIGIPGTAGTARGWTQGEWGAVPGTTPRDRRSD